MGPDGANPGIAEMPISSLKLVNLGPFDEVRFDFDPHINILVGPNNTGKSTVLFALAELIVDKFRMPRKLFRRGEPTFTLLTDISGDLPFDGAHGTFQRIPTHPVVKSARSGDQIFAYIRFIPAIRWNTDYRGTPTPRDNKDTGECVTEMATLVRDDQIVQHIIDLDYRGYRKNSLEFRESIERVFACVSAITDGYPIQYHRIEEDKSGLFVAVTTPDGTLPLNNLSQGTQGLVQWIGRLVLGYAEHYDFPVHYENAPAILIIDEIDAHLHPSWQRRILPALTKEFPALQIFCSTHSPLMLAGLKAGQVHLLTRNDKGKVVVSRNETDIEGWSADEIMSTYLDVKSTTDVATQERLNRLDELRAKDRLSRTESAELESLRTRVGDALAKSPTSRQVRAVADDLRHVVDKAVEAAGNGRKAPTKKPTARRTKSPSGKRARPKAK